MIAFKDGSRKASGSALWQAGLMEYDEVQGIEWEWQSVDGAMTKAPFGKGATGPNPTDRAKSGVKRSMLTDGAGIPLAIVVDGANRHDSKLLCATLDGIVIARPETSEEHPQHLCLDAAYDYPLMRVLVKARGYLDHIRSRGEEKAEKATIPGYRARRWVVEATQALINYAFTQLQLKRIVATTTYENVASMGVMRKVGMRIEKNPYPDPPWFQVVGILENGPATSLQAGQ